MLMLIEVESGQFKMIVNLHRVSVINKTESGRCHIKMADGTMVLLEEKYDAFFVRLRKLMPYLAKLDEKS